MRTGTVKVAQLHIDVLVEHCFNLRCGTSPVQSQELYFAAYHPPVVCFHLMYLTYI